MYDLENECNYFELRFDKYLNIIECLLRHTFDKNSFPQSEIILNEITKCIKCISHENLCWRHADAIETILINDVQNWIVKLKK